MHQGFRSPEWSKPHGHKPQQPQTITATKQNGHILKQPLTKSTTLRNGLKLEWPQTEMAPNEKLGDTKETEITFVFFAMIIFIFLTQFIVQLK